MRQRLMLVAMAALAMLPVGEALAAAEKPIYLYSIGQGVLSYPKGVAVAGDGTIHVVDSGNRRVVVFDPNGAVITTYGEGVLGDLAYDIAMIGADAYVADTNNHRIVMFRDGVLQFAIGVRGAGDGQFSSPHGIVVTPDGLIEVADTGNNRLQQFTPDGTFVGTFSAVGMRAPIDVAIDELGNRYVTSNITNEVAAYSAAGAKLWTVNAFGEGFGQVVQPSFCVLTPDGTAVDTSDLCVRMQRFNISGTPLWQIGDAEDPSYQFSGYTQGIAYDGILLYVIDAGSHVVTVWGPGPTPAPPTTWGAIKALYK